MSTNPSGPNRSAAGSAFLVLGGVLGVAGIIWAYAGFYLHQAPFVFGLMVIGLILARVGVTMKKEGGRDRVAWRPPTPPNGAPSLSAGPSSPHSTPAGARPVPPPPQVATPALTEQGAQASREVVGSDGDARDVDVTDADTVFVGAGAVAYEWVGHLPEGQAIRLGGATYLGRDPAPPVGAIGADRVIAQDEVRTVSKTHAVVAARGGALSVTDLHSTNGTRVEMGDGSVVPCIPGMECSVPDGATIALGDYRVRVERRRLG